MLFLRPVTAKRAAICIPRCVIPHASNQLSRFYSDKATTSSSKLETDEDLDKFLSEPTWSVQSLLPTKQQIGETTEVTSKQLHHLLRLAALPQPCSQEEENQMLDGLKAQLHFVKEIQKVDTTGVEPLRSLRDESVEAEKENEFNMESLGSAFEQEEIVGKHHKRVRRKQNVGTQAEDVENWDVLGQASSKVGKYFVVHHRGES